MTHYHTYENCHNLSCRRKLIEEGYQYALERILKEIREVENEPQYLHEAEDWVNGLIIAEEIIERLKENNERPRS